MRAIIILMMLFVAQYGYCSPLGYPLSQCLRYNPYTWEVYSIMYNKPRDYNECVDLFTRHRYNINYCSSNSIITLNIVQVKNDRPVTMTTSSGSGGAPQSTTVNDLKCKFSVNFTFDKGTIFGGEVAMHNHATSNDKYEVKIYNKTIKDELVLIKSGELAIQQEKKWNNIELNEVMAGYGEGQFQLTLYVQFIRNNEDISCQDAQSIFTTNCNEIAETGNSPALVILSNREPIIFRRTKRNIVETVGNNKARPENAERMECKLQETGDTHYDGQPAKMCMDKHNQICEAKETREVTTTKVEENVSTIETRVDAISC